MFELALLPLVDVMPILHGAFSCLIAWVRDWL
jgi:hypothetical protein